MSVHRIVGVSLLLCVAGACAPVTSGNPPRPIAPQEGPRGSVRATYYGGLLHRTVDATFHVEQNAYVLVGHLGGDGVIRVLYPTNGNERGLVKGGKMLRTRYFNAHYDAAPSFFFARTPMSRAMGAAFDSYDGRGNGYVFMVASRSPLAYDEVSDFGLWEEVEVSNYYNSFDPRIAVRDFADLVSGGYPYSLDFASSFSSFDMDAFASGFECALFENAGFFGYNSMWNAFGSSPWSFGRRSLCGRNRYAYLGPRRPTYTAAATTPSTPSGPANTPTLGGRPVHRPGSGPRRTFALDRSPFGSTDEGIAVRPRGLGARGTSRSTGNETTRSSRPFDSPRMSQPRQAAPSAGAPQPAIVPKKQ